MARANTWALVGSDTLMGREVRDLVAQMDAPVHLKLTDPDVAEGAKLTVQGDEPALISGLDESLLREASIAFLTCSAEATQKVLAMTGDLLPALIDLTHATEDHPRSLIRAPFAEPGGFSPPPDAVHSIAHAAAIAVAMVLSRLHHQYPIARSAVHIFEPASERGTPGVEELQQQTASLLSFKKMPKRIYDAQLAFNMLARYGEEAPIALDSAELRIERHLATLLSRAALSGAAPAPMPSLRLIQAPVFHGYSMSLWVEFEESPGVEAVEAGLVSEHIDVRGADLEPPTSVGMAGQSGIAVGGVSMDRNVPQACWIWIVADNLRLVAENAVAVGSDL